MWLFKRLLQYNQECAEKQPFFLQIDDDTRKVNYNNWDIYIWKLQWKIKEWFWQYTFKNWDVYEWYRHNDKRHWYWIFTFADWRKKN